MKKKLLIGAIVVLGIAAAFAMPLLATGAAIAAWIYLVWIVRKRKADLFHDQVEPEIAEKRLKWLKTFLWAAAIALAGGIAGFIAHNVIYGQSEIEEPVSFIIALAGLYLFIVTTGGGLAIFLKGRPKTT
jgi:hypothetical protein